jgi:hypothetical protein
MSAQEIALNELQWRSARIIANAGEVVSWVLRQPVSAVKHARIRRSIDAITIAISEFLTLIHSGDSISALEAATPEQRYDLGRQLDGAYSKVHLMIARIDVLSRPGSWKDWYAPRLGKIRDANNQLKAHANALLDRESSLILLTKRDQEFLLKALLNPEEPSEELRRVFAQKS